MDEIPSDHIRRRRILVCILRTVHEQLPPHIWTCSLSKYRNFYVYYIFICFIILTLNIPIRQYQLPRGLRRVFAVARLLELRVRIQQVAWMYVSCECWLLLGKVLCVGLILRPEESYRVCVCVCVCMRAWVWSWSLDNEEAVVYYVLLRDGKKTFQYGSVIPKLTCWDYTALFYSSWGWHPGAETWRSLIFVMNWMSLVHLLVDILNFF